MHADDALRSGCRSRDLRDRERRRVRREDGLRTDDSLELAEELELRTEGFDDRLDDEVAVGEVGEIGRERQRRERRLARLGGQLPLVDFALEEVGDPIARLRAELVRDFAADRLVPGLDRKLGDPGAHRAEPDDADASDLASRHDGRS